jgi:hypothetical protein
MTRDISYQVELQPGVAEFLRRHGVEGQLHAACDLVHDCFPESRAVSVRLQEDPDEDNHTWVVLHVLLPAGHPEELLTTQRHRYYEELVRRPKLPYHPLSFALVEMSQE